MGKVTKEAAGDLDLPEGIPVIAGLVDATANYLACGIVNPGENAMSLGTSSCWGIYHEDEVFTRNMNITRAPWNHGAFLTNAGQAATGSVFGWIRNNFAKSSLPEKGYEEATALISIAG